MKPLLAIMGVAALAGLSACDSPQENAVENAYENEADMLDNQADMLEERADNMVGAAAAATENMADTVENKAEAVREAGEDAADRIDAMQ